MTLRNPTHCGSSPGPRFQARPQGTLRRGTGSGDSPAAGGARFHRRRLSEDLGSPALQGHPHFEGPRPAATARAATAFSRAPARTGAKPPARRYDFTEAPNQMWGTDATATFTEVRRRGDPLCRYRSLHGRLCGYPRGQESQPVSKRSNQSALRIPGEGEQGSGVKANSIPG